MFKYLFLDRDGVINKRLVDDYVKTPDDFIFEDGVLEAIRKFAKIFDRIVVVTNQQGIGKGLMTEGALQQIHQKMLDEVTQHGGRIDAIFFCPDLKKSNSLYRKPNIGMGLAAKKMFPEIRFKQSVMAGDSLSDMKFAKKLGMSSVFISKDQTLIKANNKLIDSTFESLSDYADHLT